ncbi:hypothetical protein CS238_16815 [Salmonella enterica]|nr:hypothetical protein [Salmonella enterica]EJC8751604.1 hypothetical protein [Salmonella enterica]HCM1651020.1 hypothetical protein [Salmonella enterica subsp. diarizonae serovar 48:i:z35]
MNKSQSDADIKRLTAAVTDIAVISYSALGEIAAIVKLLLLWLETQEAYRDPETIIRALDNIIYTAQNTIETVGHEAEAVGVDDYIDLDTKRRQRAAEEYRSAIMSEKQNKE